MTPSLQNLLIQIKQVIYSKNYSRLPKLICKNNTHKQNTYIGVRGTNQCGQWKKIKEVCKDLPNISTPIPANKNKRQLLSWMWKNNEINGLRARNQNNMLKFICKLIKFSAAKDVILPSNWFFYICYFEQHPLWKVNLFQFQLILK